MVCSSLVCGISGAKPGFKAAVKNESGFFVF
jgi:hypothetical protein